MPENAPRGPELFTMMFKIASVIAVVFFLIYIFTLFRVKTEGRFLERNAYQLGENIYSSQEYRTIFDKSYLDNIKDTDKEFFARSCDAGYFANIRDLSTNEEWSFGYQPEKSIIVKSTQVTLPVGIVEPDIKRPGSGYENAAMAVLSLTLYDTYTTRMSCIVEKAFLSKEVQSMRIPCLFSLETKGCAIEISTSADKLCIRNPAGLEAEKPIDCRISKYPLLSINEEYDAEKFGDEKLSKKFLVAYPIKIGLSADCETLKKDKSSVASADDEVRVIRLCLEDLL